MRPCSLPETSAAPRRCSGSSRRQADRPSAVEIGEFVTLDYDGLEAMIREFLQSAERQPAADRGGVLRRRRRGDRRCRAADQRALAGRHAARVAERTGIAAVPAAERPRGAGLRRPRAGARRTGGAAAGRRERERQRGRHRRRHRPGRGDAAQRRRPLRAGRVGGRARRLRAAYDARAADDRSADEDLRPRQRRARRLRARPREHLSVHPRLVRIRSFLHAEQRHAEKAVRRRRTGARPGRPARADQPVGARAALPAVRRSDGHVRRCVRIGSGQPGAAVRRDRRRLRRRRHRAEDHAGARVRNVPRRLPSEGPRCAISSRQCRCR